MYRMLIIAGQHDGRERQVHPHLLHVECIFKRDSRFAQHPCHMRCHDRAVTKEQIGFESSCYPPNLVNTLQVKQHPAYLPSTFASQVHVRQPFCFQQVLLELLITDREKHLMSPLNHLMSEAAEHVNVSWVIDVNQYIHYATIISIINQKIGICPIAYSGMISTCRIAP